MISAGFAHETPCRLISCAGTPQQQQRQSTLASLSTLDGLEAPTILIVGEVTAEMELSQLVPVDTTDFPTLESLLSNRHSGDETTPDDIA